MAKYHGNRGELHRIKTTTPSQQWPPPPPNPSNPKDPPMFSANQFNAARRTLFPLRSRSPHPFCIRPQALSRHRTTQRRLPPKGQREPNRSAAGSSPRSRQAGRQPAATRRLLIDRREHLWASGAGRCVTSWPFGGDGIYKCGAHAAPSLPQYGRRH